MAHRLPLGNAAALLPHEQRCGSGPCAISDSWGPQFAERWITQEEANAISQGQFTVVNW